MTNIYLNPESGNIVTVDSKADANYNWHYIGYGQHKKIISWLIKLQSSMGDFIDSDVETLRKSWEDHCL